MGRAHNQQRTTTGFDAVMGSRRGDGTAQEFLALTVEHPNATEFAAADRIFHSLRQPQDWSRALNAADDIWRRHKHELPLLETLLGRLAENMVAYDRDLLAPEAARFLTDMYLFPSDPDKPLAESLTARLLRASELPAAATLTAALNDASREPDALLKLARQHQLTPFFAAAGRELNRRGEDYLLAVLDVDAGSGKTEYEAMRMTVGGQTMVVAGGPPLADAVTEADWTSFVRSCWELGRDDRPPHLVSALRLMLNSRTVQERFRASMTAQG